MLKHGLGPLMIAGSACECEPCVTSPVRECHCVAVTEVRASEACW